MAISEETIESVDDYPIRLLVDYPPPGSLNRWLLFIKWLLVIPHYFVLWFLSWGFLVAIFFSWFAILFTGRYPRSLFNLVVGYQAWSLRATGYASLLVTDQYPPFSFGRPIGGAGTVALVLGVLAAVGVVGMYVLLILVAVLTGTQGAAAP